MENGDWYDERYKNAHFQKMRAWRLVKARYACERCGSKENLRIHHLTYKNFGHEKLDDLQVVCVSCHSEADEERKTKERAERNLVRMLRRK